MSLLNQINLLDASLRNSTDYEAIAAALNVGRTKPRATAIGKGTIIGVLTLPVGNAFLDVIDNHPDYRHIKDVIKNESFDVSLEESKMGIDAMVPAVLTQEQADSLKALGTVPDTVSAAQVASVMTGGA